MAGVTYIPLSSSHPSSSSQLWSGKFGGCGLFRAHDTSSTTVAWGPFRSGLMSSTTPTPFSGLTHPAWARAPWVWVEEWASWYWNGQWWDGRYRVWNGGHWVKPDFWGGLGCCCEFGYCCRMCPHGYNTGPRGCFWCGHHGCCRRSNCSHPCCEQVSPRHVVKRLKTVLSKPPDLLGERLGDEVLQKIAEFIIDEPDLT